MEFTKEILDRISHDYGPSFYLVDKETFSSNYERLIRSFRTYYPKTNIAYSYKTNYIPQFCTIVNDRGGYAEIVSKMEYELAVKVGVPAKNIYFNGPYKDPKAMNNLALQGGVINADSTRDIEILEEFALLNSERDFYVGLRCNFPVDGEAISRFGFDARSDDLEKAKNYVARIENIHLIGLHCHFSKRNLEIWRNTTEGMLKLVSRHMEDYRDPLRFVSLGGGLHGDMPDSLKSQFSGDIPSFDDYARVAAKSFHDHFELYDATKRPELIIEPGTAICADSMQYVTKVVDIKSVRGKDIATVCGSSFNFKSINDEINLPIKIFGDRSMAGDRRKYMDMDIGGYTCIENDYLYRGYNGELGVGDFIVFEDVGSYSIVMKPPFIMPNVAVIQYDETDQSVEVIKRVEVFDDIFRTYSF